MMIEQLVPQVVAWWRDEEGASLVEYILLVALVAVVSIAAITFLGKSAKDKFEFTGKSISGTGS
jgi:pilus assembly protein Flp/PilA